MPKQEDLSHDDNGATREARELQNLIEAGSENHDTAKEHLKMLEEGMQSLSKDIPTKEIKEILEDPKEMNIVIERALRAELAEREK